MTAKQDSSALASAAVIASCGLASAAVAEGYNSPEADTVAVVIVVGGGLNMAAPCADSGDMVGDIGCVGVGSCIDYSPALVHVQVGYRLVRAWVGNSLAGRRAVEHFHGRPCLVLRLRYWGYSKPDCWDRRLGSRWSEKPWTRNSAL